MHNTVVYRWVQMSRAKYGSIDKLYSVALTNILTKSPQSVLNILGIITLPKVTSQLIYCLNGKPEKLILSQQQRREYSVAVQ